MSHILSINPEAWREQQYSHYMAASSEEESDMGVCPFCGEEVAGSYTAPLPSSGYTCLACIESEMEEHDFTEQQAIQHLDRMLNPKNYSHDSDNTDSTESMERVPTGCLRQSRTYSGSGSLVYRQLPSRILPLLLNP